MIPKEDGISRFCWNGKLSQPSDRGGFIWNLNGDANQAEHRVDKIAIF